MAVRDLETFLRQRAGIFDPGLDVTPGSPFDTQVIQPLVRRLGTDPFTIDLSTFIYERINQAFPDLATSEGDAITDLLIKPLTLLWDPIVREVIRVRQGQSFRDASQLTVEEAEALGANIFSERRPGQTARGPARIFFAQPQNITVTPINFVTSKTGLHFFPTETQAIRTNEMLLNIADDGSYYFDINVLAEAPGVEYNIEPNSLASIAAMPSAVRVANVRRFSSGEDEDTAEQYINRAEGELTERSMVTLRGISAKITKAFPEVRRLNSVGFNDPEMERDILKGGGLGELLFAGSTGSVDDDGEGRAQSRRFRVPLADADLVTLTTAGEASSYIITILEVPTAVMIKAFVDLSNGKDLHIRRVFNDGFSSYVDFDEQVLNPGAAALYWTLRRSELTLSDIPGGIIFPQGPLGVTKVVEGQVHIGGTTDIHVAGSSFDEAVLVLDDIADNEPEAIGTTLTALVAGPDVVFDLGTDFVLDVTYQSVDPTYRLLRDASRYGMVIEILEGPNAGSYRVVKAVQTTGVPTQVYTDPQPTVDASNRRWKLISTINVELADPRETIIAEADLTTVQGSDIVGTGGGTDFALLGVQPNWIVRIKEGVSAGDYVIDSVPTATTIKLKQVLSSTDSNLKYEVFRPNLAGAMSMPLVRVTKLELLDSSSQPVGSTVPYARPIDIQSRAFQNPARGIKLDVRDATLGVVSHPAGIEPTGTITVVVPASLVNGDNFTLADGTNAPVTFEYRTAGLPTPGNIPISIAGLTSTTEVRDVTIAAINNVLGPLRISAQQSSAAVLALRNEIPGTSGNIGIIENVGAAGFVVAGMSGGLNGVYDVGGTTLVIRFRGIENQPDQDIPVIFTAGNKTLAQVIAAINAVADPALFVVGTAVPVSTDRFGIRPLRGGAIVLTSTARTALFTPDEEHTSWDIRSVRVDDAGGWGRYEPTLDLDSGLDIVQVMDGQQVGIYRGPYSLPTPGGLRIVDPTKPIPYNAPRFAPEIDIRVQVGARSLGSVRCFFLDPTSIEFDQDSIFELDTDNGHLRYLPDPSLPSLRIPPPPETARPDDGASTQLLSVWTSSSQDFLQSGIRAGDHLNVQYLPFKGNISFASDTTPVSIATKTLIYSLDEQPDRTITFIRDDPMLAPIQVTIGAVIEQINAAVGRDVASLDGLGFVEFKTDVSFVVRKSGTANLLLLLYRSDNGLAALSPLARYDFTLTDQSNDSPHQGLYTVTDVTATTLTVTPPFPDSGYFPNSVAAQTYTVERLGVQRICTTTMALNQVEPDLYFFDVELVSEGTGDQYNLNSDLQLTASGYRSDGYYLTVDNSVLTFSPAERPRLIISPTILENGVSDSPVNATQLSGRSVQVTYDRSQLVEDVNNFATSETERVICASPLSRHLIPHFVRFALRYTAGSSADLVKQDLEAYVTNNPPNEAIESSDIQKIVSNRGAISIQNPIDLIAVVHPVDRNVYVTRSQNALTTGRLAAFVPDVLDVQRNTG